MQFLPDSPPSGIRVRVDSTASLEPQHRSLAAWLTQLELPGAWRIQPVAGDGRPPALHLHLDPAVASQWAPGHDTLALAALPGVARGDAQADLMREILLALLLGPVELDCPSLAELQAQVRMRRDIALAARATALAFHTAQASRPMQLWRGDDDQGYTVRPGVSLIDALRAATQPAAGESPYAFSCYRATEYVILLGIAQELERSHPALLDRLQRQCESRVIRSAAFHDVFLREIGSLQAPLPACYYVPGDRVWFRNPDEASADVSGFEGSWVIYLGGGLFANFWRRDEPFTLRAKCLEVYHWRHGTYVDAHGELRIDEARVLAQVRATEADPAAAGEVLARMMRMRDPRGVYAQGGCIDATREHPKWVCPGTADLELPGLHATPD